jgi:hypothetical protein
MAAKCAVFKERLEDIEDLMELCDAHNRGSLDMPTFDECDESAQLMLAVRASP